MSKTDTIRLNKSFMVFSLRRAGRQQPDHSAAAAPRLTILSTAGLRYPDRKSGNFHANPLVKRLPSLCEFP